MKLPESRLTVYQNWLAAERGLRFDNYDALWRWSVTDLPAFWGSIWDYFDIKSPTPYAAVLADERMPGAKWFEGAQVNYARQVFRHAEAADAAGHPAIVFADEVMLAEGRVREIGWLELQRQTAAFAATLKALGVQRGDRVCAVLPHTPQTIAVFLAVTSLGAIWSICSPDMGQVAIVDRFRQIEPKILVACDACTWAGLTYDRRPSIDELLAGLPSVQHAIRGSQIDELLSAEPSTPIAFEPEWLPFDHPLWIVYSSGTTGLPKPIVHGHGGMMIESLKVGMQNNVGATIETRDRFHWFSTTGWIMWNVQVGALLGGTTLCIYDGNPGGPSKTADWTTLWRFVGLSKSTMFGSGAAFFAACLKADVRPMEVADLSALRAMGSTGSPLSDECFDWIWERCPKVGGKPIWIDSASGGTDFAGAFVGGNINLPQVRGQIQCRWLGAAIEAWDEHGKSLTDEVGELVCTRPMPSMPLRFWNDPGDRRYIDSYFDMYPGVWRHGDWLRITQDGGAIIYGRSDATINRQGVRMGTAEIYRAVETMPEVLNSLVVDLEYLGRESWMPLFVVLREGIELDESLILRMKANIRTALGPRYVPSEFIKVEGIPQTLTGKKMELPIKKLLLGADPKKVLNRDAMANPSVIDWFVAFARDRAVPAQPQKGMTTQV